MAFLRLLMAKRILGFAAASFIAAGHPQIAAPSPSAQQVQTFSTVDQTHVAKRPTSQGTSVVPASEVCPRPQPSSTVPEPADLRAENGVLTVDFAFRSEIDAHGRTRYCYIYKNGVESPTLRLNPGDLLILRLKNELMPAASPASASAVAVPPSQLAANPTSKSVSMAMPAGHVENEPCSSAQMNAISTNLHFHGLTIPPVCHQDDVLHTSIQANDPPFEYRVHIPSDQPPGLYWYHPHLHGFTRAQVMGGASGALIIEGIERANRNVAGLAERVIVIRDEDLLNPQAAPSIAGQKAPSVTLDRDGDARNTADGSGTPAKDLSLNFVSVPYPGYQPATIRMRPSERQLWRIVNASSITYLNLQLLFRGKPQALGVVAVDGAPVNDNGKGGDYALWQSHLGVPPAGRIEFIVKAPPAGTDATLITRSVNTGPAGENDPTRPLASIVSSPDAPEPQSSLPAAAVAPAKPSGLPWLGSVTPIRTRKLYFSEQPQNPSDPNSPMNFYLTVEGQTPALFDPHSFVPNIVVHQGDVEDWIIENRSQELHDFHIHQVHFVMLEWFGIPINEPFLRDTIPVPFWDGKTTKYPTVRLRMDFRDANAVGLFPFHCHLLEHEDGGMMGVIRVEPAKASSPPTPNAGSPPGR
ncbi:MAG: multicopper oxidase domain-containing protein [Candidatus Sulfotelmatobacter sp.]|jgi:FtsP/CotA-like multicopper oxidase with cupredoxin domain